MVRRKYDKRSPSNASLITTCSNNCKDQLHKTNILVDKYKKRRVKNRVLQEIKHLQKATRLLIPKAPFGRLVREILYDHFSIFKIERIHIIALEAIQEAAEMYIIQFFEDALLLCLHSKRVTLMQKDMVLLRRLRGRNDIINK